jgi:hypothetical protein
LAAEELAVNRQSRQTIALDAVAGIDATGLSLPKTQSDVSEAASGSR